MLRRVIASVASAVALVGCPATHARDGLVDAGLGHSGPDASRAPADGGHDATPRAGAPDAPHDAAPTSDAPDAVPFECAPGDSRPCLASCGTSGNERCDDDGRWSPICVPPQEQCGNGIDDDCDGLVDPGFVRLGPDTVVNEGGTEARWPQIVWTGDRLAVAWDDQFSLGFATVSSGGQRLSSRALSRDYPGHVFQDRPTVALAWSGSRLGLATFRYTGGESAFRTLSAGGTPLSSAVVPGIQSRWPVGVSAATGFVALGWDERVACCATLDSFTHEGESTASVALDGVGDAFRPPMSMASNGREIAILRSAGDPAGTGSPWLEFERWTPAATSVGPTIRLGTGSDWWASGVVVWDGTSWRVVWVSGGLDDFAVRVARLDAARGVVLDEVVLRATGTLFPTSLAAVWTGAGLAVAWSEGLGSSGLELARTDERGVAVEVMRVGSGYGGPSTLAWTGSEVAIAWTQNVGAERYVDVLVARVGGCF